MKKFLSKIPIIVMAVLMVLSFGIFGLGSQGFASAQWEDESTSSTVIENNSMYLTYAGESLVGIDKNGKVYRSEDGSLDFSETGHTLQFKQKYFLVNSNNSSKYGANKYVVYGENTVVAVGLNSSDKTVVSYSRDKGLTWTSTTPSISGYPISVVYGNGLFALMTITDSTNDKGNLYISEDGITWVTGITNIPVDYNFNFSNGYFFRTQYFKDGTYPEIYYSTDMKNWDSFTSPIPGMYSSDGNITMSSNPSLWVARVNNQFYIFGDNLVYTSPSLEGVWQYVDTIGDYDSVIKAVPYQNGVILTVSQAAYYIEFPEVGMMNKYAILLDFEFDSAMDFVYVNTIVESDTKLVVGYSGHYGAIMEYAASYTNNTVAIFKLFTKQIKHTVNFVDYNGSVISSIEVPDGETVIPPTAPTRIGYTFVGWDKDVSQIIYEDTTFTAVYEQNKYTVNFVDYNGNLLHTTEVAHGSKVPTDEIPTPSRDSHQFTGWNQNVSMFITSDTTFVAQYTEMATLTVKFPQVVGMKGLENQFYNTEFGQKTFTYLIGDEIRTTGFNAFYETTIAPWINDYANDSDYDYDTKFISWDKEIPEYITEDITITASYIELHNVRLEYYSQVRFSTVEDYYFSFIGFMKIERLVPTGTIIELEDFKKEGIDYESYSAHIHEFYNNLRNFEFVGWSEDITKPITEDIIIAGEYKMPTINVKMYDADNYLFNDEDQAISFLSVEDIKSLDVSGWDTFVELLRNFFLLRWDEIGEMAHENFNYSDYINKVSTYNSPSSNLLTPFVVLDVQNPDIYGGIFMEGSVNEESAILQYHSGSALANNLTYWINPIVFANDLYPLTVVVTYGTALDSVVKEVVSIWNMVKEFFTGVLDVIVEYWWIILIVVLAIIFRKPLGKFLSMIFDAIKKFFVWLGKTIKGATKKKATKKVNQSTNKKKKSKKKTKKEKSDE